VLTHSWLLVHCRPGQGAMAALRGAGHLEQGPAGLCALVESCEALLLCSLQLVTTSPSLKVLELDFFSEISSSLRKRNIYLPDGAPERKFHDMWVLMHV